MKLIMKPENNFNQKGGETRMKYIRKLISCTVATIAIGTLISTSMAAEDVRNTKHNLSSVSAGYGTGTDLVVSNTTEVCIFCHTPHGGTTTVGGGAAPLWNRNLPDTSTGGYTPYSSPNFDGAGNTPGTPKGVSVACLSCHDGTVAFDSLLNFGGSGSTDNITMTTSTRVNAEGFMINDAGKTFPMLGRDLSNDHPISMEIPCATYDAGSLTGGDPQFDQICTYITGQQSNLTAGKVAYIDRSAGVGLPADPRDRIRAYPGTTTSGGVDTQKAYIECASCHNPHEADSTRFLRHPSLGTANPLPIGITASALNSDRNMGSLLCLSCHQK